MKNILKILCITIVISSCQTSKTEDDSLTYQIASSSEYQKMMDAWSLEMYSVATQAYNPEEIIILNDSFFDLNPCDNEPSKYSHIVGISTYLRISCMEKLALQALQDKFKYRELSLKDRKEINTLFHSDINPTHRQQNTEKIFYTLNPKR